MKKILMFAACCLCGVQAHCQQFYGNVIKTDAKSYGYFKNVIDDLKQQLGAATGTTFTIDTKDSTKQTGIQIVLLNGATDTAYDKRLATDNADAALIISDGVQYLRIVAYTQQGITNGIYTYLDTLGFRWYHPGEAWANIPQLKDIRLQLNEVLKPDFALRTFFGTWGTPRNRVVDPKAIVDHEWEVWATRNRMGGAYTLKGHAWNDFLWRNFSALSNNPECMALVNGERVKPNTSMKFCVSNKNFQDIFVTDMVAQLQKQMAAYPNASVYCVSVEPSDGEGFCECDNCRKIGGVSEQVFYLANLVAKAFQKISPRANVNLYAYNTHAAPPKFDLEPNVIVQIIPYGYQHYASPQEMLDAWKKKGHKLFIYDYYGLPIDNIDMPLRGDLKPLSFANRIKYWHNQRIMGATLESSYSIGCTGLGLYLFARLGWNVNSDANKLADDYYKHCFGKMAEVVKQADQDLSNDTMERICALSTADLLLKKQTMRAKMGEQEQTCMDYYKGYLHYLKLLYDAQFSRSVSQPQATDSLMRFTYGIFQTMMVHQFPVNEYFKTHGPAETYVKENWDTFKPTDPKMKFNTVVPVTPAQMDEAFEMDCKEFSKPAK